MFISIHVGIDSGLLSSFVLLMLLLLLLFLFYFVFISRIRMSFPLFSIRYFSSRDFSLCRFCFWPVVAIIPIEKWDTRDVPKLNAFTFCPYAISLMLSNRFPFIRRHFLKYYKYHCNWCFMGTITLVFSLTTHRDAHRQGHTEKDTVPCTPMQMIIICAFRAGFFSLSLCC